MLRTWQDGLTDVNRAIVVFWLTFIIAAAIAKGLFIFPLFVATMKDWDSKND